MILRDTLCPAQSATEFAITYGEPLLSYARACVSSASGAPATQLYTNTAPITPEHTTVVSPNVDTLYMSQCYDISREDLVITIPEVDSSRYYGVSFYTPEGDDYLNLGSLAQTQAGRYLLTPAVTSDTAGQMVTGSDGTYQGTIYSPRTLGYLLIRIALKNQDSDVEVVNEIERGFNTTATPRGSGPIGPELTDDLFTNTSSSQAEYILALTALFNETVPSANGEPLLPEETTSNLSVAGIGSDGTYQPPDCVNLEEAYSTANTSITNYRQSSEFVQSLNNGWVMARPIVIGQYGDNYEARAVIARIGYLGLTEDQVIYPVYLEVFSLGDNESYTLRFAGKPPVADNGFWSITMYSPELQLVPNSINRYSLGDRSNLTYPDGTLVYGTDTDGPFDILVQASQPPANWTSNWLPSPRTLGPFSMTLRFYIPDEALSDGSYIYPQVIKGAVVSGTNWTMPARPKRFL
ncbi:hypothetical protein F4677DRAFT_442147 [Hypoxylon crocopeplum]|nr:hypothetical protein F4677DRAFT_442147 [Hypoxylon crocopeplum]